MWWRRVSEEEDVCNPTRNRTIFICLSCLSVRIRKRRIKCVWRRHIKNKNHKILYNRNILVFFFIPTAVDSVNIINILILFVNISPLPIYYACRPCIVYTIDARRPLRARAQSHRIQSLRVYRRPAPHVCLSIAFVRTSYAAPGSVVREMASSTVSVSSTLMIIGLALTIPYVAVSTPSHVRPPRYAIRKARNADIWNRCPLDPLPFGRQQNHVRRRFSKLSPLEGSPTLTCLFFPTKVTLNQTG